MMRPHHLNQALPYMARNYSRMFGVNVRVGGNKAYSTQDTIFIPALDLKNPLLARVTYGFMAHEAGHIRFSDFDVFNRVKNDLKLRMLNSLEDCRIEALMARNYIGVFENLELINQCLYRDLIRQLTTYGAPVISKIDLLCTYLIITGHVCLNCYKGAYELQQLLYQELSCLINQESLDNITALIKELPECHNTADICTLCDRIYLLMIKPECFVPNFYRFAVRYQLTSRFDLDHCRKLAEHYQQPRFKAPVLCPHPELIHTPVANAQEIVDEFGPNTTVTALLEENYPEFIAPKVSPLTALVDIVGKDSPVNPFTRADRENAKKTDPTEPYRQQLSFNAAGNAIEAALLYPDKNHFKYEPQPQFQDQADFIELNQALTCKSRYRQKFSTRYDEPESRLQPAFPFDFQQQLLSDTVFASQAESLPEYPVHAKVPVVPESNNCTEGTTAPIPSPAASATAPTAAAALGDVLTGDTPVGDAPASDAAAVAQAAAATAVEVVDAQDDTRPQVFPVLSGPGSHHGIETSWDKYRLRLSWEHGGIVIKQGEATDDEITYHRNKLPASTSKALISEKYIGELSGYEYLQSWDFNGPFFINLSLPKRAQIIAGHIRKLFETNLEELDAATIHQVLGSYLATPSLEFCTRLILDTLAYPHLFRPVMSWLKLDTLPFPYRLLMDRLLCYQDVRQGIVFHMRDFQDNCHEPYQAKRHTEQFLTQAREILAAEKTKAANLGQILQHLNNSRRTGIISTIQYYQSNKELNDWYWYNRPRVDYYVSPYHSPNEDINKPSAEPGKGYNLFTGKNEGQSNIFNTIKAQLLKQRHMVKFKRIESILKELRLFNDYSLDVEPSLDLRRYCRNPDNGIPYSVFYLTRLARAESVFWRNCPAPFTDTVEPGHYRKLQKAQQRPQYSGLRQPQSGQNEERSSAPYRMAVAYARPQLKFWDQAPSAFTATAPAPTPAPAPAPAAGDTTTTDVADAARTAAPAAQALSGLKAASQALTADKIREAAEADHIAVAVEKRRGLPTKVEVLQKLITAIDPNFNLMTQEKFKQENTEPPLVYTNQRDPRLECTLTDALREYWYLNPSTDARWQGSAGRYLLEKEATKQKISSFCHNTTLFCSRQSRKTLYEMPHQANFSRVVYDKVKAQLKDLPGPQWHAADVKEIKQVEFAACLRMIHQVRFHTGELRRELRQHLRSFTEQQQERYLSGRTINVARALKIPCGETRIFNRKNNFEDYSVGIHLLIDSSSSMTTPGGTMSFDAPSGVDEQLYFNLRSRGYQANHAALTLALALDRLPGIKTQASFFPDEISGMPYHQVLKANEHATEHMLRFWSACSGSTPLTEALNFAGEELMKLGCTRNIIIIITDGQPNDKETFKAEIKNCIELGIEVVGIGIDLETCQIEQTAQLFPTFAHLPGNQNLTIELCRIVRNMFRTSF